MVMQSKSVGGVIALGIRYWGQMSNRRGQMSNRAETYAKELIAQFLTLDCQIENCTN